MRRVLADGGTLDDALELLRQHGATEMMAQLKSATPLRPDEIKTIVDHFLHGGATPWKQLTGERLALLKLARGKEPIHDFYRRAVLTGHRWLTLAPAPSGYDLWFKSKRSQVPEESWSGNLPSLLELAKNLRAQLAAEPRLAFCAEVVSADEKIVTLRFYLDGDR